MANTDNKQPAVSDPLSKQEKGLGGGSSSPTSGKETSNPVVKLSTAENHEQTPAASTAASTKPAIVPERAKPPAASQPKKFSAVNINKKFLEKNSTTSNSASTQSSSSLKSTGPVARPSLTPAAHPSRLVTAKLTATLQPSTTTGPGWSRPSSVAPTLTTPNAGSSQLPPNKPSALSHTGKVIQPQPRITGQSSQADILHKPAWGKIRSTSREDARVQSDFPTAAEVAQSSRVVKAPPVAVETNNAATVANNQARMEEADTFRGVHLDPNAHHWDEMEEDDNFFDSVVEFGDGRRYEVETAPEPPKSSSPPRMKPSPKGPGHQAANQRNVPPVDIPVSKEERFADDFDRSWPRGSPSLSSVSGQHGGMSSASVAAPSPKSPVVPLQSPEASRVLFNERSNRLEPYSNARPGSYTKDTKSSSASNVQVLQKAGDKSRGVNGVAAGRDLSRRDSAHGLSFGSAQPHKMGPPPVGRSGFTVSNPPNSDEHSGRSGYAQAVSGDRGRRMSNMAPPPIPNHVLKAGPNRDSRQAWEPQPNAFSGRTPSRESKHPSAPPSSASAVSVRHPSRSPVLSNTSAAAPLVTASPVETSLILPPNTDINELRKDVMQSAAARAKQRRQQEEEEREKERERARQKAAGLEARIQAAEPERLAIEQDTQDEATALLDEVAKAAASPVEAPPLPLERRSSFVSKVQAAPQDPRPPGLRRGSVAQLSPTVPPAVVSESWRSHANRLSTPVHPRHVQTRPRKLSNVAPSIFDHVENLDSELEVVDFSDLGKFMGVPESVVVSEETPSHHLPSSSPPSKPTRAVAIDFFDDTPAPVPSNQSLSKPDTVTWRRKESSTHPEVIPSSSRIVVSQPDSTQSSPHKPRPQYKEAAMSALDDAMSRIKGALDGMHDSESLQSIATVADTPVKQRWIPPALRPQHMLDCELRESFCTVPEPPHSPKPVWNTFAVRLPQSSHHVEPISKKQLALSSKMSAVRWEILSFDPPVEGMSKREFMVNEVLFRTFRGNFFKSKTRYRVVLPKRLAFDLSPLGRSDVPPKFATGAFGKARAADELLSWRSAPLKTAELPTAPSESTPESPAKTDRSKLPKMPAGSSVAFYRDSQVVNVESDSKATVSFIVTSELEDSLRDAEDSLDYMSSGNGTLHGVEPEIGSNVFDMSAEHSTANTPAAPWPRTPIALNVKDVPIRGPDPEHLKALWSSTSHPSALHPINSLEGIADDLTSVPFTLQDVKSEDGETPPPTMSGASRMSLHDVTRAFQQVPSSASAPVPSLRPSISPPTTTAPVARPPPNYSYGVPIPQNNQNMRPSYAPYPSSMMSPSPAPIVYPMAASPVPARMQVNGHHNSMTPMYAPPPVWMPMAGPNTPGGQPQMMRPYPQMMSYSPSAQPMYLPSPQSMPAMAQQQQNANGNRSRSVSMMSPGMVHASPSMYGSPVMMPARPPNSSHPPPPTHSPANPYTPTNSFMRPAGW